MLLALLLVTRAAAEWVEISQQHYRKPVRVTTALEWTTTNTILDAHPTKNTYLNQEVIQTPTRDTYLNQNVQNSERNNFQYPDVKDPMRNTHLSHDVYHQKPMRDDFITRGKPTRSAYFDEDTKPVRINPFLQDVSQSSTRNTYYDQEASHSIRDNYLNKRLQSPTKVIYPNHSITEHNWNQNVPRPGNGRRDSIQTTTIPNYDNWNENTHRPNNDRNDKPNERRKLKVEDDVSNVVRIEDETVSGKVERVPALGSVKRVQLADTPVKSPTLNTKVPEVTSNRKNDLHSYETHNYDSFSDELDIETNIFHSHGHAVSKKPSHNLNQDLGSTEDVHITGNEKTKVINDATKSLILPSLQKHSFTHKPDGKLTQVVPEVSRLKQKNVESTEVNKIIAAKPQEELNTFADTLPNFVTVTEKNNEPVKEKVKNNIRGDENRNNHHESVKSEKMQNKDKKESSSENGETINTSSGEIKVNTMENILKFMKVVADTISKNTKRGNGKITYLNELKHTLLANIKDRIDATWPDDTNAASRRHSRSASPRGHVEFPSSESALMTISFLTFAVFLIKLVLQVIQTYKNKAMVMAPLMIATARRAASKKLFGN